MVDQQEGRALLRAIIDNPEDDDRRLIYADWLEDAGDAARALFIRLQMEAEGLGEPDKGCPDLDDYGRSVPRWLERRCVCRGCALRRNTHECMAGDARRWSGMMTGSPIWCLSEVEYKKSADLNRVLFRRGFVETVKCRIKQWGENGRTLAPAHPLRYLSISDRRPTTTLDRGVLRYRWLKEFENSTGTDPMIQHALPPDMYRAVSRGGVDPVMYATEADAYRALIAWGRTRAAALPQGGAPGAAV